MHILKNYSLRYANTLGIRARSRFFASAKTVDDLVSAVRWSQAEGVPYIVLGGGSNIVFARDQAGLALHVGLTSGITRRRIGQHWLVSAAAGMSWHMLVQYCAQHDLAGIENLAHIPGTVGAAPIQNIGAYGCELADVFDSLEALDTRTSTVVTFRSEECAFGYRESIFKREAKDRYVITAVTLRLRSGPAVVPADANIRRELQAQGSEEWPLSHIVDAVGRIRWRRLPRPETLGNAGSFFVNPVLTQQHFTRLRHLFPSIPGVDANGGRVKTSAGWLINTCGFRGTRQGACGVYFNNPLVFVNYGEARGAELLDFADAVATKVHDVFDVQLQLEPRVY